MDVELTDQSYLHLSAEVRQRYFPSNNLVALVKGGELWLLPTRGAAAGGLLLKQRNRQGDCTVLIWEVLPPHAPAGNRPAVWDEQQGALRITL